MIGARTTICGDSCRLTRRCRQRLCCAVHSMSILANVPQMTAPCACQSRGRDGVSLGLFRALAVSY